MIYISNLFLPLLILFIIIYGIKKKVNVYDEFIEGAKEGINIGINLFPTLLGMIFSINLFINCGILPSILDLLKPIFSIIKVPVEIVPISILRPISGSASLVYLSELLNNYGPDSLIGRIASTIQGSTDTTFYVLTLYFGSVGIKKIRHSLFVGLISDVIGIIISIIIINLLF